MTGQVRCYKVCKSNAPFQDGFQDNSCDACNAIFEINDRKGWIWYQIGELHQDDDESYLTCPTCAKKCPQPPTVYSKRWYGKRYYYK